MTSNHSKEGDPKQLSLEEQKKKYEAKAKWDAILNQVWEYHEQHPYEADSLAAMITTDCQELIYWLSKMNPEKALEFVQEGNPTLDLSSVVIIEDTDPERIAEAVVKAFSE